MAALRAGEAPPGGEEGWRCVRSWLPLWPPVGPGDGTAVPSVGFAMTGAQIEPGEVSVMPPADGVTKAVPVNHDTASAILLWLMEVRKLIST